MSGQDREKIPPPPWEGPERPPPVASSAAGAGGRRLAPGGRWLAVLAVLVCALGVGVYLLSRTTDDPRVAVRPTPTVAPAAASTPAATTAPSGQAPTRPAAATVAAGATQIAGGAAGTPRPAAASSPAVSGSPVAGGLPAATPRAATPAGATPGGGTQVAALQTPTRAAGPATPPAAGGGGGDLPAGWQVYTGTRLPFAMAYPPGWVVDESRVDEGVVYFRHPTDPATWVLVATGERTARTADELRDERYAEQLAACRQGAIDVTRDEWFSGVLFKAVGVTCERPDGLYYAYLGVGLRDGVPWRFQLSSPYGRYSASTCGCHAGDFERYFAPMLERLTIYARP